MYVGDPASTGEPPKQLEGYQRVSLEPGQSETGDGRADRPCLCLLERRRERVARSPSGCYSLMVGTSSADLSLHAQMAQGAGACRN